MTIIDQLQEAAMRFAKGERNKLLLVGRNQVEEIKSFAWSTNYVKGRVVSIEEATAQFRMSPEEKMEHLFQLEMVRVDADSYCEIVWINKT